MKRRPRQPTEIDDTEDHMGGVREVENEFPPRRRRQMGMTGGETLDDSAVEDHVSLDDMAPETLIDEQGTEAPFAPSDDTPVDKELHIVHEQDIGGGSGLDEAEKARVKPQSDKPGTRPEDDEPV